MPISEARTFANQMNAANITGPKTHAGKDQLRRDALKHGMTGTGVVLPEADTTELKRRIAAFVKDFQVKGDIEVALDRHAALQSVRMERGADQQAAVLSEYVRQAEIGFVLPEDVDAEEADQLRSEFARRSMFDVSHEATLARRYKAAERGLLSSPEGVASISCDDQGPDSAQIILRDRVENGFVFGYAKRGCRNGPAAGTGEPRLFLLHADGPE